ncbi:molybdopterin molybdotransferase MoeA [Demequina aurantiaca]|uniref:molybdopterin molybdotransferase MoeA n=1 Tax=Demequina aurantiaca TaxID=676200 RepID=UPI000785648C|nr:gephyrin-like molybdotransferase Glp [Demequina aurantiaca]
MRSVAEHVAAATALVSALPTEEVSLGDALGRVLADPVNSRTDNPPFDNSAMDGYAVRGDEVAAASDSAPVAMIVSADIPAGSGMPDPLAPGTVARIMTGAPVPEGADAIVPVEHTDAFGGAGGPSTRPRGMVTGTPISIAVAPALEAHIRRRGEDVREGDEVLRSGTRLGPWQIAAAASAGVARLTVARRPRVAVLATGDELTAPGQPLPVGSIYDSNGMLMTALAAATGADVVVLPRAGDDPARLLGVLAEASADLIVTSGGVSVGAYDVVKAALASRGVDFVPVAMQPGKPQGLGVFDGTPIVCLPGNPVSVAVSFAVIVAPMLRAMVGEIEPELAYAVAATGWRSPPGRQQHVPVRINPNGTVEPATGGGSRSHLAASLAHGEALAVVAPETTEVSAGDTVGLMRRTW